MPVWCAASRRDEPSRTMAIASSRRLCAVSRHFAAKARSSAGVWSVCVILTAMLMWSPESANRREAVREFYFASLGNPPRVKNQGGWYNLALHHTAAVEALVLDDAPIAVRLAVPLSP